MLQFLLVMALQFKQDIDSYGNPYDLYIQRNSVVAMNSAVGYICKDWRYTDCTKNVVELCQLSLANGNVATVQNKCSDIEHRIKEGLR